MSDVLKSEDGGLMSDVLKGTLALKSDFRLRTSIHTSKKEQIFVPLRSNFQGDQNYLGLDFRIIQ